MTHPTVFSFDDNATAYYRGRRFVISLSVAREEPEKIAEYLETIVNSSSQKKIRNVNGITIFNEPVGNFVARSLSFFVPSKMPFFVAIFASNFLVLLWFLLKRAHPLELVSSSNWLGVAAVIFAVMLVHELGHAAAACKAGIRVDRIGLGLYLVFPALFTSVSMVRLLPPLRQIPIILGGTFAQCAALLGLAALITGLDIRWLEAPYLILQSMTLFNLTPIFQLDGRRALEAYQAASGDKTARIVLRMGNAAAVVLIGWVLARQVNMILLQLTIWRETGDAFSLGYGLFILAIFVVGMTLGARTVMRKISAMSRSDEP